MRSRSAGVAWRTRARYAVTSASSSCRDCGFEADPVQEGPGVCEGGAIASLLRDQLWRQRAPPPCEADQGPLGTLWEGGLFQ